MKFIHHGIVIAILMLMGTSGEAQTNSAHVWKLKNGNIATGPFFSAGNAAVVIKQNGTNCVLPIARLSVPDLIYLYECKTNARAIALNQNKLYLQSVGAVEFKSVELKNFAERYDGKNGWVDGKFEFFSDGIGRAPTLDLGFEIEDRDGQNLDCVTCKIIFPPNMNDLDGQKPNPFADMVAKLKRGDQVRFIGSFSAFENNTSTSIHARFFVDQMMIIETASERDQYKKLKGEDE